MDALYERFAQCSRFFPYHKMPETKQEFQFLMEEYVAVLRNNINLENCRDHCIRISKIRVIHAELDKLVQDEANANFIMPN